jgi:hypothetical protein
VATLNNTAARHQPRAEPRIPQPYLDRRAEDAGNLQRRAIVHFAADFLTMDLPTGVRSPVLVTVGQREDLMMKRAARSLTRMLPAGLATIPRLGHLWHPEAPQLFAGTVRA